MNPVPAKPATRARRWTFRLAAVVLALVAGLGGLELALRVAGIGWPTGFFLPATVGGRDVLVENPRFTWRFLTPELARAPQPLVVPVARDANTLRVVVLGESAAMGDPEPAHGFPRVLQALLEARLPGRKVEVINAAVTAINSHAIREIARDCEALHADAWVLYMGNNEVMGPYGPGTVFGSGAPSPALVRAGLWLKTTRTGQWLDQLARRAKVGAPTPGQWGGLEMFLDKQVRADDPRLAATYDAFAANLDDILASARRCGARVVASTVAVNLRDHAPFASAHSGSMDPARLPDWDKLAAQARASADAGNTRDAIVSWARASEIDGGHAETAWRLGTALLAEGNTNAAAKVLGIARDADTLRFRADSRINEVIRKACANRTRDGIWLVDAERTFAVSARDGVPGDEFFWEHVHFRPPGSYLLALAAGTAVLEALPAEAKAGARPDWIPTREVAARLALTTWGEHRMAEGVRQRMRRPPFSTQANAAERDQRLQRDLARLAPGLMPTAFNPQADVFRKAIERAPDDWVLHDQFGKLHESFGDAEGALREWRLVIDRVPGHLMAHLQAGRLLATKDATASNAVPYLLEALRLRPGTAEAHAGLGQAYARLGRLGEAEAQFARAAALRPDLLEAQVQWGVALANAGRAADARAHLLQALSITTNSALSHLHLARLAAKAGDTNEARARYLQVMRLAPRHREAREFLLGTNAAPAVPGAPAAPSPAEGPSVPMNQ